MQEYTEAQRTEYLELAKEVGHARAMRELGFPKSFHTGIKWAKQYGVDIQLNQMAQFANDMKKFYSHEEKLFAAQLLVDRIVEAMQADALGADELKKLSEALKRGVETMNLVEGKATSINQNNVVDPFDNDIAAIIEEQERINRAKQQG